MKILLINSLHHRRGGADVVYLNTGELLESFGHEIIYFSQSHENNYHCSTEKYFIKKVSFFNNNIFRKLFSIPRFFYSFESYRKLEKLILFSKPSIAHIHLFKGYLTPSIFRVLKKYNIPTVLTIHDYGYICPHNLLLDGHMLICEKCVNSYSFNCVIHKCNRGSYLFSLLSTFEFIYQKYLFPPKKYLNKIISVSKFSEKLHIKSVFDTSLMTHIYNFSPIVSGDYYSCYDSYSNEKYFLFFGRLSKEKGIDTLISAWSKRERKTVLKIVGIGSEYNRIKRLSEEFKNIEVIGFKDGEELKAIIKNSFFVIIPSEWYENNPMTIIESYAYGIPVIGSKIAGIPEIVNDKNTGFLFEMKNSLELSDIIEYVENISNEEYNRMSINAKEFYNKYFHPNKHYIELMNLYTHVIYPP